VSDARAAGGEANKSGTVSDARAAAPASAPAADQTAQRLRAVAERLIAAGPAQPRPARDPVNLPLINNWVEAIGDANPVYTDPAFAAASVHGALVAPPAMIQVWTMAGLSGQRADDDPTGQMVAALDEAGYRSVVATNADQVYHRYLRHGEELTVRTGLLDLTGPKRTALGEGWFFTTRSTWYCGDEAVATMDFRILKFRPPASQSADDDGRAGSGDGRAQQAAGGPVLRPVISPDTAFFWDGTAAGELRIQRCQDCGALRHPPGPMCQRCGSPRPGYLVASGTGEIFSYVVHHHPPVPGKTLPVIVVLVQLDEGVRMVGELTGARPEQVRIGLPVKVAFARVDGELTLPVWRLADERPSPVVTELPGLSIDVTTTFVIAAALATRDFTDVHHDRDQAVAKGGKDIFLNILTTTGLVQRFVSQWAGPQAVLRRISIRLGVPCYAGDTLTFSGQASRHIDACEIAVTGRCGLGDHVTGTVLLSLPAGRS
jgi:uncharacterized OB-fold protein/acyl dehydratase